MDIPENKYLGTLCIRKHDWEGTGKSLRSKIGGACIICAKEYDRIFSQKPEQKEHKKIYRQKPKNAQRIKERMKEYYKRPEIKEHRKIYKKKYRQRPEVIKHEKKYKREWKKNNSDKNRASSRRRTAIKNMGYLE